MKLANILCLCAFLGLSGCGYNNFETVIDLDCGDVKLQFEENEFYGPPDMPLSHFPKLYMSDGLLPRRLVDSLYHNEVMKAYELLAPEDEFFLFPPVNGKIRPKAEKYHPRDIFVDPGEFSPGEFSRIEACLIKNLPRIDLAFDRPLFEDGYVSSLRLRSIIYRKYEDNYRFCGDKVLGKKFDCEGGQAYIKTITPRDLQLCRPGTTNTNMVDLIGHISADQLSMQLRGPGSAGPADHPMYGLKALAGPDWKAFYKTCRDTEGKNIFDYFKVEPWKE
jgi:hypothetical protein